MKQSKCVWGASRIEYLGYVVDNGRLSVPEARACSIKEFIQPRTVKQMRSFLGTVGYYCHFVPDFAQHLNVVTHKNQPNIIQWTDKMLTCYLYSKNVLCEQVQLTIPTSHDDFVITCDASVLGIGAVLSVYREGQELPVSFFSRQLLDRETRCTASELEWWWIQFDIMKSTFTENRLWSRQTTRPYNHLCHQTI